MRFSIRLRTEYSTLHSRNGYEFFRFSNILPIGDMKGDVRSMWELVLNYFGKEQREISKFEIGVK